MKLTSLSIPAFVASLLLAGKAVSATVTLQVAAEESAIRGALATAAAATSETPYEIVVADGTCPLSQTLAVPAYVTLRSAADDPAAVNLVGGAGDKAKFPCVKLVANATLRGVTVRDGSGPNNAAGGVWLDGGGTLTNAWVLDCVMNKYGGCVYNNNGLVSHCRIWGGQRGAAGYGMGLYQTGASSVTRHSDISNNRCESTAASGVTGGGAYVTGGLVEYCTITNNLSGPVQGASSYYGGICLKSATLDHCLIAGNVAMSNGGIAIESGTAAAPTVVRHCTVVGNRSRFAAGIFWSATVKFSYVVNTIVYDNYAVFAEADALQDVANTGVENLSVTGLCARVAIGESALVADPLFVDPENRDYRLAANSPCRGAGVDENGAATDLGYANYDGAAARAVTILAVQPTVYVSKTGSKTPPYDTAEKATDDIFEALAHCGDGSVVIVDDGDYPIDREIALEHGITVRGANGPGKVRFHRASNDATMRILRIVHPDAVFSGLTAADGKMTASASFEQGALAVVSYGMITNCVLESGSSADIQNGAACVCNHNGIVVDSLIRNCSAGSTQGGAYWQDGPDARLLRCSITNCVSSHNSAIGSAAFLASGEADRCRIEKNVCSGSSTGVGASGVIHVGNATIRNSLIADNYPKNKNNRSCGVRLASGAVMENCTVVSNRANAAHSDAVCGGISFVASAAVTLRNVAVFGNTCNNYAKAPEPCDFGNSSSASVTAANCAVAKMTPSIAIGENCLEIADGQPLFKGADGGYRPAKGSALVNTGARLDWMADALDLDGNRRVSMGSPDIGAYEFRPGGALILSVQ